MESQIWNRLIDIEDLKRLEWKEIINEMHHIMNVSRKKQRTYRHCTDRKSLIHRAEIESYKHWEYPWAILASSIEPNMSVLDCGCGRGFLQIYLALKQCRVTSIDISTLKTKAIKKLWNIINRFKLPIKEDKASAMHNLAKRYGVSIDFYVHSIDNLPFEDNTFDRVYCISVLEHMPPGKDENTIKEMSRVLKPKGRLIVSVDFSPKKIPQISYDKDDIFKLIEVSGLRLLGEYNYEVSNWESYLNGLQKTFCSSNSKVSSAGFVLVKD